MKKNKTGIIYSTNPDFEYEYINNAKRTIEPSNQNLKISNHKLKSGKTVVFIKNFIGTDIDLKSLAKMLKIKCGVGGSAKNNEIIIQGNIIEKVINILKKEGYKYKRVGG